MREAIPPPLKRSPSLYTREAYFIRNNPQWNAVQNKRRCRIAPSLKILAKVYITKGAKRSVPLGSRKGVVSV